MGHIKTGALALAMALPSLAHAEIAIKNELVLGYGNAGAAEGGFAIGTITATDEFAFGSSKLSFKGALNLNTLGDDMGEIDNDYADFELGLDMGAGGKLTLTTFNTIGQKPWADGELFNRGSVGVFPAIAPRYRGVQGVKAMSDGVKADNDLIVKYEGHFGKIGLEAVIDPLGTYGPYTHDDLSGDEPVAEVKLTYPTAFGIYSLTANDLSDYLLTAVYPVGQTGLTLIANHQIQGGDTDNYKSELVAAYHTETAGLFKGAFAIYAMDSTEDKFVLSTNWGNDTWNLMVGGDSDGDLAVEGSYRISDTVELLAAYDNGHTFIDGFDDAINPPVFAPARGDGFEVALRMTF